jgi:transmembrane sensor
VAAASAWLARRDRGLTAPEQDEFLQWLREDERHGLAFKKLEKTWGALDLLTERRPARSALPNPDLLVRPPRFWQRRSVAAMTTVSLVLAAAAAVVLGLFPPSFESPPSASGEPKALARAVRVIPPPERLVLADGSVVELNEDGRIENAFSAVERRVRLTRGEAYFTVTKDSARPFVVEVGGVAVRAIGTAFNVRRVAGAVEVLVTEGNVQVEQVPSRPTPDSPVPAPMPLAAGQRVVVEPGTPVQPPVVVAVTARDIERALAWQGVRLKFEEIPLSEVVTEFNLRNRQQLVIGDPAVAGLRVGGTFRADNVEAFARLLELSFGIAVEPDASGALVLRQAP